MHQILIDAANGAQDVLTVGDGGGYFDTSKVLWDERDDGPLPQITLGGMVRNGVNLVYSQARMDISAAVFAAETDKRISAKIDALWNAADKYVAGYISGIAIGLLTLGVVQGKPKALAVTAWSSAVWDAYYTRKASVTAASADDLDFSTFGPMPHTVPELRTELGL